MPAPAVLMEEFDKHVERDKPIANCPKCKGTGITQTTYNPNSKFQGYSISGYWNGWFLTDSEGKMPPDYDDYIILKSDNIAPIKDLLEKNKIPGIVIEPDGTWNDFVAEGADEPDTEKVKAIYNKYIDKYGVVIDCSL